MADRIRHGSLRLKISASAVATGLALGLPSFAAAQDASQALAPNAANEDTDSSDEEIVVTGTNIRGVQPTSPIRIITKDEIDRSGYSQIGDLMRSLPENFSGGQNPGVVNGSQLNPANRNLSGASTINLRGMGSDATLTLVNGRRLAADTSMGASDISAIPLGAIERIEVVTDGASALYGSDAVAGVVNFILRRDYDGIETSARIGGATDGGGFEQTYSFLGGRTFGRGYVLLSAEYSKQDSIEASQRDYASGAFPRSTLVSNQERKSVYLSAGVDLTDDISASLDALFSEREAAPLSRPSPTSVPNLLPTRTPAYSIAGNIDMSLPHEWTMRIDGVAAGSRNDRFAINLNTNVRTGDFYENNTQYAQVTLDGPLLRLPSGELQLALGGGYRHEDYTDGNIVTGAVSTRGSREVKYAFAETMVPFVLPSEERVGLNELELSMSGRIEDYTRFGTTANPKLGLRYVPINGLSLRATWGTSFKAPTFNQTSSQRSVVQYAASFFGIDAPGRTILMPQGGNPDLKPERSESWTFGLDYTPAFAPTMTISATYFNIEYRDRIVRPLTVFSTALQNPNYAPFIDLNPSPEYQRSFIDAADRFTISAGGPYDPANVIVLARNQLTNASRQYVEGVDIAYRQRFALGGGSLEAYANATWLRQTQITLPGMPAVTYSGRLFGPPEWKGRGGLSWRSGGLTATGTVNYVDGEIDNGMIPNGRVSAWTTVDATVSYLFEHARGPVSGVRISASVSNLFNNAPAYAESVGRAGYIGLFYDSLNTSPVGRFIALQVSKRW